MILTGPPVQLSDFTTPIRLVRDPSARLDGGTGGGEKEEGSDFRKKKKTRIIYSEENQPEEEAMRTQESVPWLLEDFDGQHSYLGRLEGGGSGAGSSQAQAGTGQGGGNYVFFVNQGNEFRVLPAHKWYRFTPKLAYRPLTLEEAEEQMTARGRNDTFDRWIMRKKRAASGEDTPLSSASSSRPASLELSRLRTSKRQVDLLGEGMDFEEIVDDDDEGEGGEKAHAEEDPSMPRFVPEPSTKKLSQAGKAVRRLVRHLDSSGHRSLYDSENEEDDDDDERGDGGRDKDEEAMKEFKEWKERTEKAALAEEAKKPKVLPKKLNPSSPSSSQPVSPPSRSPTISPASSISVGQSPPSSPSSLPSPSPSPSRSLSQSSAQPSSSSAASSLIKEEDIIAILRAAPLKTRDLIARFKTQLRADPRNKDIFRDLVRRLASVRPSPSPAAAPSTEDDKLLELKPEYR